MRVSCRGGPHPDVDGREGRVGGRGGRGGRPRPRRRLLAGLVLLLLAVERAELLEGDAPLAAGRRRGRSGTDLRQLVDVRRRPGEAGRGQG